MAASDLEVVGGPLDGYRVARRAGKYVWIRGYRDAYRGPTRSANGPAALHLLPGTVAVFMRGGPPSSSPRDGSALYEHRDGVLLYAGHRRYFCNSCRCYHERCEGGREKRPCALGGDERTDDA